MTEIEINPGKKRAEIFVEGEKLAALEPQQLWDLSNELREFAIDHADGFTSAAVSEVSVHGRSFKVMPLAHPEFWDLVNSGSWEPDTFSVFDRFITSDTVFLDVGAWIGSTALYGAQLAAETHAFEPDPIAFDELRNNTGANRDADWFRNLHIHRKAIAAESGSVELGSKNAGGDSMSSVLFANEEQTWEVDSVALPTLIEDHNLMHRPLFIKIDIEGGEYTLIPALKTFFEKNNATVFLALHPEFLLESIQASTGGRLAALTTRWRFYKKHVQLLKSLPFDCFEHSNGKAFNKRKHLLKALLLGQFPHSILAWRK